LGAVMMVELWDECRIDWRRSGRFQGQFVAVYAGEAPWSLAARSTPMRVVGRRSTQPRRTRTSEACLAELCRRLERDGWCPYGPRTPHPWYTRRFYRVVPELGDIEIDPPPRPEQRSVRPWTLRPVRTVPEDLDSELRLRVDAYTDRGRKPVERPG
jgi:hypothetical protein